MTSIAECMYFYVFHYYFVVFRMSFPERLNLGEFVEAENEKEFLASSKESKAGDEAAGGDSLLIHSRPDPDEGNLYINIFSQELTTLLG